MFFTSTNDSMMDVYSVVLEVEVNGMVQRKSLQAPRLFIEQEFMSLVQQAYQHRGPMKVRMYRKVPIWDQFEQKRIEREDDITIKNKAYLNMEKQWEK